MKKTVSGAIAVALVAFGAVEAAGQQAEGEFGFLVPGEGAEETYIYCAACHSERLVAQQGLTRKRWDELFKWMVEEQGMHPIDEPERTLILDYLVQNYGPARPNFPR